jgi:hypothetical protein
MPDTSRYFNPPDRVSVVGRKLRAGSYEELLTQLMTGEALVGLYTNQANALVATHLVSRQRMNEMESSWKPSLGYYAVPSEESGFDPKIA